MIFQKQRVVSKYSVHLFIRLLPILVVIFFSERPAVAIDASVELTGGHDDNVNRSSTPTSSMFTRYRTDLSRYFFSDLFLADCTGYVGGKYQDYFSAKDNYQIYAGVSLARPLAEGRFVPSFFYEGTLFWNNELPEDSMNEHCLGGRFEWVAHARISIEFQQTWCWKDYRNEEGVQAGVQAGSKQKNMKEQGILNETYSREDRLNATGFLFRYNFTPETDAELLFTHDRSSSTIDKESYVENGVMLFLLWEPSNIWEIYSSISWEKADYDHAPNSGDRRDTAWNIGAGVSRLVSQYELFFRVNWTRNDSSLAEESYTNMVTLCGVSRSF
ncbi:MAG: hypothetical protein PF482_09820 [Desulfobacteraceae bacterium]|jgi:hypothetical protein|nr:hypothetical protein [Desulfobacteraceae bacterium]